MTMTGRRTRGKWSLHGRVRICSAAILVAVAAVGLLYSAEPPELINYQGVLRDAADNPLTGDFDMTFNLYSDRTAGLWLMEDRHLAAGTGAVSVSGGQFAVNIGSGAVNFPGPTFYTSMSEVFANHQEVWLEIAIDNGGTVETLSPRVRIASAGYALNAGRVGGRTAGEFIDTSDAAQSKIGPLTVDTSALTESTAFIARSTTSGVAGSFQSSGSSTSVGYPNYGLLAEGATAGGHFTTRGGSGVADLAMGDEGVRGGGSARGGYFYETSGSGRAYLADGNRGLYATGNSLGGEFRDSDDGSLAWLAYGGYSLYGTSSLGAYIGESGGGASASIAYSGQGIEATGPTRGARFTTTGGSGTVDLADGEYGVRATGGAAPVSAAGVFTNPYGPTACEVTLAYSWDDPVDTFATTGLSATGTIGGEFSSSNGNGSAQLATSEYGVRGWGDSGGGYFADSRSSSSRTGYATVGQPGQGVVGYGTTSGGYFADINASGYAYAGFGDSGVEAAGAVYGGRFRDTNSSGYSRVGYGSYKISGTGQVSFIQNHPYDPSRVIVYTAPEGDEAATYTRGTARLSGGEARIRLGETFEWVTNPDLGLTAHLTPHGEAVPLAVVSLSTRELVVRGPAGGPADLTFDYIVYGLRIGFEETSVVQPKTEEAFIPAMTDHRDAYAADPDLRRYNALERFRTMELTARPGKAASGSMEGSRRLIEAIHEFDPSVDHIPGPLPEPRESAGEAADSRAAGGTATQAAAGTRPAPGLSELPSASPAGSAPGPALLPGAAGGPADLPPGTVWLPVSGDVVRGDLLVLDEQHPGMLRASRTVSEPGLVGVALAAPVSSENGLLVPVASCGIVEVRADASWGEIRPGDLLSASGTPGHAMRALEFTPGTLLGRAIDGLAAGGDTIQVVVSLR